MTAIQPFTFIHAADLHLDSPFKGMSGLPGAVRERIKESTFAALERLVHSAFREKADFVVISGDIYDAADRSLRAQLRFQKAVSRLAEAGIGVYLIHGNHDPMNGGRASLDWPDKVHVFPADRVESVEVTTRERGIIAEVHGMSFASASVTENLARYYRAGRPDVYQIALLHTNVDGDPSHDNYAPCTRQQLIQSGMHYWALGHIHTRAVLHEEPYIVYPGNIQGRSIKECGPRGCYVVRVGEDGGTDLDFIELNDIRWELCKVSIEQLQTEQELKDLIEEELERLLGEAGGKDVIVRFILEGRGPLHLKLRDSHVLDELVQELREEQTALVTGGAGRTASFVWIESAVDRTGRELDLSSLKAEGGFLGDLISISEELLDSPEQLEAFVLEACKPLMDNPKLARALGPALPGRPAELLAAARELALDLLAEDRGWEG